MHTGQKLTASCGVVITPDQVWTQLNPCKVMFHNIHTHCWPDVAAMLNSFCYFIGMIGISSPDDIEKAPIAVAPYKSTCWKSHQCQPSNLNRHFENLLKLKDHVWENVWGRLTQITGHILDWSLSEMLPPFLIANVKTIKNFPSVQYDTSSIKAVGVLPAGLANQHALKLSKIPKSDQSRIRS